MTEFNETSSRFADCLLRMAVEDGRKILSCLTVRKNDLLPVEDVVTPALEYIGQVWEQGQISLSQVYMAGRICERLVNEVLPSDQSPHLDRPRLAIAVLEDYHTLGKQIVSSALRASGYHLLDLGHGLKAVELVEITRREQVDVLFISCLMLASALRVKDVVRGLEKAGTGTVIVVGGAPFRLAPLLWKEVGAHYKGCNSGDAVKIINNLKENRHWR